MRYLALACDYDETLAHAGIVLEITIASIESLLASDRKLIVVTGDAKTWACHLRGGDYSQWFSVSRTKIRSGFASSHHLS
jgi:hypothetical protein